MGEHEIRRRAVFLYRDGVINQPVVRAGRPHPPADVKDFELYEDVPASCARLHAAGYLLVVVTQPAGCCPRDARRGQPWTRFIGKCWISPSHADCTRGSLLARGREWDSGSPCDFASLSRAWSCAPRKQGSKSILTQSFLIGDRWRDVDCGHAAGCRTVFIDRNYSESLRAVSGLDPLQSFGQAVEVILGATRGFKSGACAHARQKSLSLVMR